MVSKHMQEKIINAKSFKIVKKDKLSTKVIILQYCVYLFKMIHF